MPIPSLLLVCSRGFSCLSVAGAAGLLLLSGCGGGDDYRPVTAEDAAQAEAHVHDHHAHKAPHGGHLIELGDHLYNAEVVSEESAGRLVVYILDAHAENAVPVALKEIEFTVEDGAPITLKAEPQPGDPQGQSSRFMATDVSDVEDLHGSLQIEINGQTYSGELAHDHHDHEDDHEGHHHTDGDED